MPASEIASLLPTAHRMADAARAVILPMFRTALSADNKDAAGFDPVTEADRAAEQAMRAILAAERPQDAILGEEFGATEGESGLTWVLDPIDGTRAFISGTPTWGVLIAVTDAQGPVLGVMDQPYTGERWEAAPGVARFKGPHGGQALATKQTKRLADATLFTTFPEVGTPAEGEAFDRVKAQAKLTRYGLDCYAYGLVALGQVDLVIEAGLNAYDICAHIALIEAAGGIVTDWEGGPVHHGGRAVAAANPTLHAQALALLQGGAA